MQIATITVQLSGTPLMFTSCHGAISRNLVSRVVACYFLHLLFGIKDFQYESGLWMSF